MGSQNIRTVILNDDEEVNSLPLKASRRKLFVVPLESGDDQLTNNVDPKYAFAPQAYTPRFPSRNSFSFKLAGDNPNKQA